MEVKKICEILSDYFSKEEKVACVYLFGSTVNDDVKKNNDIDVAILFEENCSSFNRFDKRLEYASKLEDIFQKEVDVVNLESCDLYFIRQVMLNNILVLEKNRDRRVSFEVKQRKLFFDMKHLYDRYYDQMLKRLERGEEDG
ncbi:type VII toxin-antitoxin system MntA family adenylyltransferase antitoxin [Natranaerobius thermophilus]|uniref:DNA polymerase beta domain protein region n=1 Tax=Natranaerobius thermophilus (strain ATCC BAA-1301 / DSM 18059 / JW/NM-WN-LF) TaxID=457570 RepID=B2A1S8_NATTJ|nr:nucleotidyltransferase domain-containing protein [Natranaerobius thermophilus]ACB86125.1 DNA polymerase beta domain protein region [Natranaerobius thermophilus JW/NM-WN-LF]